MNSFVSKAKNIGSGKYTENGKFAYGSTGSDLLNFFATAGALRKRSDLDVVNSFIKAFNENPLYATRALFYSRNIRGGLGERRVFRTILKWLANESEFTRDVVRLNLDKIVELGRFDDLYTLVDTPLESYAFSYLYNVVSQDVVNMDKNKPISLAAKWMKSINSSSEETKKLGKLTAKYFGMSHKTYRKMLSELREYLNVVETDMSENEWNSINYEHVPSKAMTTYRKAFGRHDSIRFGEYVEDVSSGKKKINSGTLYPYDIFEKMSMETWGRTFSFSSWDKVLQQQWNNLPNYVEGNHNVLVMADTSGSMEGRPMNIALSLAFYFAERNKGDFSNLFMTFSMNPRFVVLSGKTLKEKIKNVESIVANTNLEAAFNLILDTLVYGKVSEEDAPKALVVISDMEIDNATTRNMDFHFYMEKKYSEHGYKMPTVVYWNVDARQDTFHVDANRQNTILVSGSSASTFKNVMDNIGSTPYESMIRILNSDTYSGIQLPE